jgi:hypothetical protein
MPSRAISVGLALSALLGGAIGIGAGWLVWGRPARPMRARLAVLEAAATEVQGERERLHHELADIVRERREMASTAEHLRAQIDRELERLEALSDELAPPEGEAPPTSPPAP